MGLSAVAARKLKAAQDAAVAAAAAVLDQDEQPAAKKVKRSEGDEESAPGSDIRSVNEDGVLEESSDVEPPTAVEEGWDEKYANAAIAEVEAGMKKSSDSRYFAAAAAAAAPADRGRSRSKSDLGSDEDDYEEEDEQDDDEQHAQGHAGPAVPRNGGHPRAFSQQGTRQAAAARPFQELTTWRPSFGGASKNVLPARVADGVLTLGMMRSETITFVGIAQVHVVRGAVACHGAEFVSPAKFTICAPRSGTLPTLTSISLADDVQPGSSSSSAALQTSSSSSSSSAVFPRHETVLEIASIESLGLQDIGRACPILGEEAFDHRPDAVYCNLTLPHFSIVSREERDKRGLQTEVMQPMLHRIRQSLQLGSQTIMVQGPKRAGKSTMARSTLYHLLAQGKHERVAFLDLDPGQTEFGPPGLVSLHVFSAPAEGKESVLIGPSWCTPRKPVRAHFIGDTSPKDVITRYLEAFYDLIEYYKEHFALGPISQPRPRPRRDGKTAAAAMGGSASGSLQTPLIVNTMGWTKGLGADLLAKISARVEPDVVVDFVPPEVFQIDGREWFRQAKPSGQQGTTEIFRYPAAIHSTNAAAGGPGDWSLTPVDQRNLNLMSYFHLTRLPEHDGDAALLPTWSFQRPLVGQAPYEVDLAQGFPAGVHILPFGAEVVHELRFRALDCSLAAVVQVSPSYLEPTPAQESPRTAYSTAGPAVQSSSALGLALIRAVKPETNSVQLLTPLSAAQLHASSPDEQGGGAADVANLALVKGAIALPIWAFLDFELVRAVVAGRTTDADGAPLTLAGVALDQVPYLQFPERVSDAAQRREQRRGKEMMGASTSSAAGGAQMMHFHTQPQQQQLVPILDTRARKIRRNVMRRSQVKYT